ncbi:unnamed protein product [Peniophora sp. CBMAI 1063]|nr:unnamed protein product [Peniophora sp. CBMAI 1063]
MAQNQPVSDTLRYQSFMHSPEIADASMQEEVNAVLVYTTDDLGYVCDPLKNRDQLREHLYEYCLSTGDDKRFRQGELADVFNTPHYKRVCSFFPRDPMVLDWYYTVYTRKSSKGSFNAVAAMVCEAQSPMGEAVIVKDCPADKWDVLNTEIDADELAKTLWFYHKSGTSAEADFAERTLLRMLVS